MAVTKISYERLYNLGNYENEKFIAIVTVEEGDVAGAFTEARQAIDAARSAAQIEREEEKERIRLEQEQAQERKRQERIAELERRQRERDAQEQRQQAQPDLDF